MPRPFLLLAAAVLAGCAGTTRAVGPASFDDARLALSGRSVTVVLTDGAHYAADALRLEPDTTTWVDRTTGALLAIPTADVLRIERRDRGRSAARTAGAGALVGAGLGLLFGAAVCTDLGCSGGGTQTLSSLAALGHGMGGALYGAIGGAIANRPDRWELGPMRPVTETP